MCILLCVFFGLTNQVSKYFEFLCKTYLVFENLKGECLKILILGKLGLKLVFWKSVSSHTLAFYSLYSMIWEVFFQKPVYFFQKFFFSRISIDPICFSINQKSWISFFKIRSWLIQLTIFKSFQTFLSLSDSARLHSKFFVIFLLISCKVFLSISRYVHITLSFSFIFNFTCIFSCIEGLFSDLAYFGIFDDSNRIFWNWSLGFCSRML